MEVDGGDVRRVSTGAGRTTCGYFFPSGERILFSSTHHGDPEIYKMRSDGSDLRRLTREEGYDGGAFFSPDGTRIVYRGHHPTDPEELAEYRELLADGLVRPSRVELFVMNADGTDKRQVTYNGAANFAPFFHPDGERVIFSSNLHDPGTGNFDLYLIGIDGTGLERITDNEGFDGFPMFDREGKRLVFASSRGATAPREFNIFLADWLEDPGDPADPEVREASNVDG